ncbi:MAG: PilZ domain-containing protein [Deltaproteobacteria bacterium]|nr:PilZ domain-containing protein [Deltaproteobacteria bacterium]MCB9788875.1 PilZ domain-containing protein [Deltaproteobacteria bacterium]
MNQNRRQFPRVAESTQVRWRRVDQDAAELGEAATMNISGGGICFQAWERIDSGSHIAVQLELPGIPLPVIALARVVWCELATEGAMPWDVGAEFHWVGWESGDAQRRIGDYLVDKLNR